MVRIARPKRLYRRVNQKFTVIRLILLIETCNILHRRELHQNQAATKDVRLEHVVLGVARVATLLHVSPPKQRRQVLRCSSDGGHGAVATIVRLFEVVLTFAEIDQLDLESRKQKQICWLQVSMRHANTLEVGKGANDRDNHLLELVLLPKYILLLAFSEEILKILPGLHVLANHGDSERVVHGFIEVVPIELQHIWMCLNFKQLDSLLLHNTQRLVTTCLYKQLRFTLYSFSLSRVLASTSLIA